MTHTTVQLQLNRRLQNHAFESWRIGSSFVAGRTEVTLPTPVFQGAGDAVDFVHTKASALHNHLVFSQGRLFIVTGSIDSRSIAISSVTVVTSEQGVRPVVTHVAVIPCPAAADAAVAPTEVPLHASLAVLATPAGSDAAAAGPLTSSSSSSSSSSFGSSSIHALMSTGRGDLVLLTSTEGQSARASAPVYPLRPRAPAVGSKPFNIAAAWTTPAGLIRAVLWCLTDTAAAAAATAAGGSSSSRGGMQQQQRRGGCSAWVCETWLVTLSAQQQPPGAAHTTQRQQQQQQQLQVLGCQLLLVSRAPVAAAGAAAAADGVLLLADGLEEGELPPGYKQQLAVALGLAVPAAAAATPMDTDTPAAPAAPAAAEGGPAAAARATSSAAAADGVEGDDDLDPRTLAAAVARLAKYTSDTEVGDLPQQQWSDMYNESGPEELGAGASEPAVDFYLYGPIDTPSSSSSNTATTTAAAPSGGGGEGGDAAVGSLTLKCVTPCGPHKLLAAQMLTGHTRASSGNSDGCGGSNAGLLVGLTDDVDCAVVTAAAAAGSSGFGAGSSGDGSGSSSGGGLMLQHRAFLPAIAYVAAGKTQKRHLLLAQEPSSPVSCVLVEGSKYAYLYGQVDKGATHGQQQILDMELPRGQSILGARLMPIGGGSNGSGGGGSVTVLLLLTQTQLVCYQLQAPVG